MLTTTGGYRLVEEPSGETLIGPWHGPCRPPGGAIYVPSRPPMSFITSYDVLDAIWIQSQYASHKLRSSRQIIFM